MQYTTTGGNHAHYAIGEAVWIVAGIIVLFVFGDVVTVLALAVAAALLAAAWWSYRSGEHRADSDDATLAPVTTLRPAPTGRTDATPAPAHTSWRGPSAA